MPFQPINFASIAPQGSPALRGLVESLGQGMQLGRLPQKLAQEAKAKEFANAIAEINAKYAEPQAQAGLAHTQAGTGSLNAGMELNPFRKALLEAQSRSAGSVADKNAMIQKLMQQVMGGGGGSTSPQDVQQPQLGSVQGMFPEQAIQSAPTQATQQSQQPQMNYAQAALMSKLMGLGQPKIVDVDGAKIAVTPFGNIPVAQGMTPLGKELTKADAAMYKQASDALIPLGEQQDIIDNAMEIIDKMPNAENVIGPLNNVLAKWTGSPSDQQLLGEIAANSGNFTLNAAKGIKGAFTGRDISLINSIKPNPGDRFDVFKGKLKALKLANEVVSTRNKLIMQKVRAGMAPEEAIRQAREQTDFKRVKPMIANLMVSDKDKSAMQKAQSGIVRADGKVYKLQPDGSWRD